MPVVKGTTIISNEVVNTRSSAGDGEAGADGQDDGQRQHDGEPGGDAVGQIFEAAG